MSIERKMPALAAAVGIHSLDHFTLEVPDLDEAQRFYEAFGLDVTATPERLELRTFGNPHVWGVLVPGAARRLSHITLGTYAQDHAALVQAVLGSTATIVTAPARPDEALWFRDPVGMLVELRIAEKSSPGSKDLTQPERIAGGRGTIGHAGVNPVCPRRLAHVLFFTPDINASLDFYQHYLGLKLSDHGEYVAFLHGIHGSDHHLLAFAQSEAIGYHHSSWDVGSLEDVGCGAMQMQRAGYGDPGWGVGRHVAGSNYFYYVRDPWNSYAEYSFDIDFIPLGLDWEAGYPEEIDRFYLWGPSAPDDFVRNYEAPPPG